MTLEIPEALRVRGERIRDERASTVVIVALLLVVLMGMAAVVVDVGALYQERRELQNGADAGALAVAKDCAVGDCGPYHTTAQALAGPNAGDDLATVDDVGIDLAAHTVKVDTSTHDAEGGSEILHWFASLLGNDGSTVRASAIARWAAPQAGATLPLTLSQCEVTGGATLTKDNIPFGTTMAFAFHDGDNAEPCNGPAGQDLAGGFGWLDTNGSCEADISVGGQAGSSPGAAPPNVCVPDDFDGEIHVPVFTDVSGTGNTGAFTIGGIVAFQVDAARLLMGHGSWQWGDLTLCDETNGNGNGGSGNGGSGNGESGNSTSGGSAPQDQACIVGHFVEGSFMPVGEPGDDTTPDLGVYTVELVA